MEAREGRIGNAFACERCRKHKVRCVPSEAAGICQRCQKARVECIEHVARRRPAKPRVIQPTTKVAEMEKRIDKLHAIVKATTVPSAPSSTTQPTLPPVATVPTQPTEISRRTTTPAPIVPSAPPLPAVKTPILPNPGSTPESALSFWESINEAISGLGRMDPVIRSISIIHMQSLLESYRAMTTFFPFVLLPRECFCKDLIQQRPILLFAVLTAASHDSPQLQASLSREFRKVVMVKIMNGEKSLDLLQGLLVFIAWHHHYIDLHAASVHLLLQMCVGIAGDLGLDDIPSPTRSPIQKQESWQREAKRAYLGCYYLTSSLGLLDSSRVRSIPYSNTLRAYARDIQEGAWEHHSDTIVPFLIDTCQFMEDVDETFGSRSEPALVAKSQLKRLSEKWDHMYGATKAQASDYRTLRWIQLGARMFLYEATASLDISDRDSLSWVSGFQLSQRITCLRWVEQFLDNSLQLAPSEFELLSITDWLVLVAGLTTLAKLALHTSPMPGWDPAELQIAKTFEYFRDQLSVQMPRSHDSQDHEDLFDRFRRMTEIMKMTAKTAPGRNSPNGSTFELATGSGRTVSLLQELPPLKPNGVVNGSDPLPAPWKVSSQFDISSPDFVWKFLMGTL
ncbi:hypothetical protein BU23DRAFT_572572 [Bimuria novae-zelandiae CBS 107.79]|uniref:Zn(2)-C6 fungal-type domain-containing protein n=1 Tax=Bimuria novae-zelandiae CBS 107.79 TaxID=1447943 RepID=A0A6A5UU32_9PLEO|nr:hypothetical protein BU23DRAFT_572572 [Bimuria novae-zelandiae CBS 107.79]